MKILEGDHGEVIEGTARDCRSTFFPQIMSKGQTRIAGTDDQIPNLYA